LSVNSFCQESGNCNAKNELNGKHKPLSVQRQFSFPNVLMSATISHEKGFSKGNSIDSSQFEDLYGLKSIPRKRLVNIVADKLQQRPFFSPSCHPVDLEGLQETAV